MAKPSLFLFDLDGTLVDTAHDIVTATIETFKAEGLPLERSHALTLAAGKGRMTLLKEALGDREVDEATIERMGERFGSIYSRCMYDNSALFPKADIVLDTLEAKGLRWGIVTNKLEGTGVPLLKWLGLLDRSTCTIFGDTLKVAKPHPEPILHALQLAKAKPAESVMIGDSLNDVRSGNEAGVTTVAVTHSYPREEIAQWQPDVIVDCIYDVLDWLETT